MRLLGGPERSGGTRNATHPAGCSREHGAGEVVSTPGFGGLWGWPETAGQVWRLWSAVYQQQRGGSSSGWWGATWRGATETERCQIESWRVGTRSAVFSVFLTACVSTRGL